MKRMLTAAALFATVSVAAACAPAPPAAPDTAAMIAAATALDEQFVTAYNAGDGAALAALYADSEDTVSFAPDSMMSRGITAIRADTAKMVATPGMKLELTESHHIALTDAVLTWGLWTMTMPGPDGAMMTMEGRFSDVKAERNGKWVYLVDHASMPMPPAPPEGGGQ